MTAWPTFIRCKWTLDQNIRFVTHFGHGSKRLSAKPTRYHIKELMIKRELMKDPELANENWERFLPHFKKRTLSKRKKPLKVTDKSKKSYTPFPPPQEKSKVDLQIESGEYFLGKQAKERATREKREERQREKQAEKRVARQKEFVPPQENGSASGKKEKKRKRREDDESEVRKKKKRRAVEEEQ